MIRFVENILIDRDKWDRRAAEAPHSNVFCQSWYLDAVCEEWHALVRGDYEAMIPVPTRKKVGFRIWYQPFFTRELTITGDSVPDEAVLSAFLEALPADYKIVEFGLVRIPGLRINGFSTEVYPYQQLKIDAGYHLLERSFSGNTRRILKKLTAAGCVVREVRPEVVSDLFFAQKGQELQMNAGEKEHLDRLMLEAGKHAGGLSLGIFRNGTLLAAGYFLKFRSTVLYLKGASTADGRESGAMYGLIDHVIRNSEGKILDFGGSRVPGIAAFFRKFGAEDETYLFLRRKLPFFVTLGRAIYRKLKGITPW